MNRTTRAAVGLAALTLLGVSVFAAPAHAAGTPAGLPRTAWFDKSYAGPVPPPSPTSAPGQLFVEGVDPGTVTKYAGANPTPPGSSAIALAALHWALPTGADADKLVLDVVGVVPPTGVTIQACPTTKTWVAGDQQMGSAAPTFDCSTRASVGYYDSTAGTVTFTDIDRTARNGAIDVALVPGMADRVVLAPPTASSLTLDLASTTTSGPEPTFAAGPPGGDGAAAGSTSGSSSGTGTAQDPGSPGSPGTGSAAGLSSGGSTTTSGSAAAGAPAGGGSAGAGSAGPPGTTSPGAVDGSPAVSPVALRVGSTVARPAAIAGLALALAFFALLLADERRRRSTSAEPAGLGRFRTLRDGPAPTL